MKKHTILLVILLCIGVSYAFAQKDNSLKFNSDGKLKIAQFSDIHWDENADNCADTEKIIKQVITDEKPDFIIITGDVVCYKPAKEGWISMARIFSASETPWAVLMGNHDAEQDMTREEIFSYLDKQPYYVGDIGSKDIFGTGNFVLPVQGSKNQSDAAVLYFLDSNDYTENQLVHGRYDWIRFNQIAWYRDQSAYFSEKNGGNPLPSLAFFHIAIPEYNELVKAGNYYGEKLERGASSSAINSGFFASIIEAGDIMGTFVGHDHDNSFIGIKNNIALGYGRVSGLNAYGSLDRGARIISLHEGKRQFDTWIATSKGASEHYYYPSGISAEEEKESIYMANTLYASTPKSGIEYTYYEYEGKIKSVDDLSKVGKVVSKGTLPNFSLSPAKKDDFFGFEYKCLLKVPENGVYKLYLYTDDGSKLFIDNILVVDNDGSHSAERSDGRIALEAGYHEMKVQYFESYMGESIEVGISSRNISETPIPDDMLYIIPEK